MVMKCGSEVWCGVHVVWCTCGVVVKCGVMW